MPLWREPQAGFRLQDSSLQSPPYVRAAAPLATRVPTESQVWDVDQVPRKKRRTNHEVGQGLEGDSSGGEATDAPPLDTLQGVVSIDKVCTHRGSFFIFIISPSHGRVRG